jgi:hypothetical protein
MWWPVIVIATLGKLRQEKHYDLEASLGDIGEPLYQRTKPRTKRMSWAGSSSSLANVNLANEVIDMGQHQDGAESQDSVYCK